MQTGEVASAHAVLASGAETDVNEQRETLALRAVAEVDVDPTVSLEAAERGVMLASWEQKNWEALAYVRSRSV